MMVIYNIIAIMGIVLGLPLLAIIALGSDKRRKTVLQRLGLAALPWGARQNRSFNPSNKPIWDLNNRKLRAEGSTSVICTGTMLMARTDSKLLPFLA